MKKNIVLFVLFGSLLSLLNCVASQALIEYTFSMNTAHLPGYTQAIWEQCEDQHDALARYCRDTENDVDGFILAIDKAIKTMTDIANLTAESTAISVKFNSDLQPFTEPSAGLIIAITFMPYENTPAEKLAEFKALAENLSVVANDKTKVLAQLNNLIKMFKLKTGYAHLRVHTIDANKPK